MTPARSSPILPTALTASTGSASRALTRCRCQSPIAWASRWTPSPATTATSRPSPAGSTTSRLIMSRSRAAAERQARAKATDAGLGPRPYPERLRWWAEGRFGLFIHWGPVSLKETEISWSRANSNPKCPNKGEIPVEVYDNLYRQFNPTNFSGSEWARLAKAAGVKYMVLTAKHCDGFLLWHSQAERLQHRAHPLPARRLRGACPGGTGAGPAHRLVFLADGLARPGLPHRAQRAVCGPDAGGSARTPDPMRAH